MNDISLKSYLFVYLNHRRHLPVEQKVSSVHEQSQFFVSTHGEIQCSIFAIPLKLFICHIFCPL